MTDAYVTLRLVPIGLREANAFVAAHHRHHKPSRGHKFSVGVADTQLRGVAIAGRPVARMLDDGSRLEVLRVCTDGARNACSMLYGAVARAAEGMGYDRSKVITYTLATEPGTSLKAAGWWRGERVPGRSWDRPKRGRIDQHPTEDKVRWHAAPPPALTAPSVTGGAG
jgi:hypothetical protein